MAERYERLTPLPGRMWAKGTPILLENGILLKDTVTETLILQLKFQNQGDTLRAISISVDCFDEFGNKLVSVNEYKYQDLNVACGQFFGDRLAIPIPDNNTRRYTIFLDKVVYIQGDIVDFHKAQFESVAIAPSIKLLTPYLQAQLVRELPNACMALPLDQGEYWLCSCGAFNLTQHTWCLNCRTSKEFVFEKTNEDYLTSAAQQYHEEQQRIKEKEEQERKEQEEKAKEEAEKQRAKRKRILRNATVAAAIIGILLGGYYLYTYVITPSVSYNQAVELIDAGNYEDAKQIFAALGNYKDAPDRMSLASYHQAVELMNAGKYEDAKQIFTTLGSYKDAPDLAEKCGYDQYYIPAVAALEAGDQKTALELLENIKGKGEADLLIGEIYYLQAKSFLEDCKRFDTDRPEDYLIVFDLLDHAVAYNEEKVKSLKEDAIETAYDLIVTSYRTQTGSWFAEEYDDFLKLFDEENMADYQDVSKYHTLYLTRCILSAGTWGTATKKTVWPDLSALAAVGFEDSKELSSYFEESNVPSNNRTSFFDKLRGHKFSDTAGHSIEMDKNSSKVMKWNLPLDGVMEGDQVMGFDIRDNIMYTYDIASPGKETKAIQFDFVDDNTVSVYYYKNGRTFILKKEW